MTVRILRAAARATVPWKNGGGTVREIAAGPEGAGTDAFDWRVSLADVTADGPFSAFPGVDRVLTVVEGAGMDLVVGGEHHIVDEPLWPHGFPGDLPTEGFLLGGPVVNLNVMYRRARTRAETAVICGTVRLLPPRGRCGAGRLPGRRGGAGGRARRPAGPLRRGAGDRGVPRGAPDDGPCGAGDPLGGVTAHPCAGGGEIPG